MNEPWFPLWLSWLPGTLLGVLAGIWGSLAGILIPKGKGLGAVKGFGYALLGASVILLVAGIAALMVGQPYAIWYGLGLAGLIGTLVLGINLPMLGVFQRQIEERKMKAKDL